MNLSRQLSEQRPIALPEQGRHLGPPRRQMNQMIQQVILGGQGVVQVLTLLGLPQSRGARLRQFRHQ